MTAAALVLVPGMLCDARLFAPQIERLGSDIACTVADVASDGTIPAMAARLLAEAPPRFALAGLSLGGIVAMEVMRQAPERVDRLCLMATNHRAGTPAFAALRTAQIARAHGGDLRRLVIEDLKSQYLGSARKGDSALLDLVLAMALDAGPDVFERQARALIDRPDQSATLKAVRVPTLLIAGAEDELCPVATHWAMAGLMPSAHLHVLPATGHLITLEAPDAATALIEAWLGEP